ncbi:MAG: hypothetical protein ACK5MU_02355 [Candidatus Saccharimonadales bacterium]
MFEVNLVPDIKADMLRKQRASNLVLFICIIVAAATAGVVLILGSIVGGQNIALANQDKEILCRSEGGDEKVCKDYGTAVLQFANVNDFLTIQDQMSKLQTVNDNKLLLSRVFGILDVILPAGDEVVNISELSVNLVDTTLNFEAQGDSISNIDYKALEVFKKSATKSYFDYGRYYRTDESGSEVEIPTMCITETAVNGVLYGVYHQGQAGCEAPLIPDNTNTDESTDNTATDDATTEDEEAEEVPTIIDIPIRRTYATLDEKENYIEANEENGGGYFFKSECVEYGDGGKFDEDATLAKCPLLSSDPAIRDSSNGRDSNDRLVLRFNATVLITKDVFASSNKHMRIVGPSRQNVTDSYTQIRDMFTEKAADCDPEDQQCLEGN